VLRIYLARGGREEIFLHRSDLADHFAHGGLAPDDVIEFELEVTERGPRARAVRRVPPSWPGRLRVWLALG
jgi:cold shock CspA family protein